MSKRLKREDREVLCIYRLEKKKEAVVAAKLAYCCVSGFLQQFSLPIPAVWLEACSEKSLVIKPTLRGWCCTVPLQQNLCEFLLKLCRVLPCAWMDQAIKWFKLLALSCYLCLNSCGLTPLEEHWLITFGSNIKRLVHIWLPFMLLVLFPQKVRIISTYRNKYLPFSKRSTYFFWSII